MNLLACSPSFDALHAFVAFRHIFRALASRPSESPTDRSHRSTQIKAVQPYATPKCSSPQGSGKLAIRLASNLAQYLSQAHMVAAQRRPRPHRP